MIGFTATYAGGEIVIDESEIEDAGWFTVDNLPTLPGKISIARKLIDWFIQKQRISSDSMTKKSTENDPQAPNPIH
jgi:NAD+ diphosphatase